MKFLIIDDEPLVRRSLSRALQARGHEYEEACDGHEGLSKWETVRPQAVFVDILMPGLSGPDVIRRILTNEEITKNPPAVVLISAFSGEDSEKLAQECGADEFIAKPFEDIFDVVDRVIALAEKKAVRKEEFS